MTLQINKAKAEWLSKVAPNEAKAFLSKTIDSLTKETEEVLYFENGEVADPLASIGDTSQMTNTATSGRVSMTNADINKALSDVAGLENEENDQTKLEKSNTTESEEKADEVEETSEVEATTEKSAESETSDDNPEVEKSMELVGMALQESILEAFKEYHANVVTPLLAMVQEYQGQLDSMAVKVAALESNTYEHKKEPEKTLDLPTFLTQDLIAPASVAAMMKEHFGNRPQRLQATKDDVEKAVTEVKLETESNSGSSWFDGF